MTNLSLRRARRLWSGNLAAILRGNVANSLLGLIAGLLLAKYLEPEGRGLLAIALVWPGIALAAFGLGLRNVTAYFASRYPDRRSDVLRAALQLGLVSTLVIYTVGFTASWIFVGDQPVLFKALLIAFLATPFALLSGIVRGLLNSIDLKLWSRARLIQPATYAGTVVLVALSGDLTVLAGAAAYLVSLIVSAACVWMIAPTRAAGRPGPDFVALRTDMLTYGLKSSLALSAQVTNVRLDIALLGLLLPASQVGLYAVASSLAQYVVPLSTAAAPWVFPRIAQRGVDPRSWREAQRAIWLTVLFAGAMALFVAALAPVLLGDVLGSEWMPALVPLWILLAGAVMQAIRFVQVSIAGAYNRPELAAYSEIAAAMATLVLLWPMVELFGVNGAAVVSVIAYSASALLLRRGIVRAVRRGPDPHWGDLGSRAPELTRGYTDGSFTVTYVERLPTPDRHFSIERVFDAVVAGTPAEVVVRRVRVPRSGIGPVAMLRNALAVRSIRSDVIHVTGDVHYVLPAIRRRAVRVLTIHDLASLHRTSGLRRRFIRLLWYSWPIAHADAVTTVSEETRRQLIAEFGHRIADKVRVIENPLEPGFENLTVLPRDAQRRTEQAPVVLAIGTAPNKNLMGTAKAALRIGASLRIVGRLDDDGIRQLDAVGVHYTAVHSIDAASLVAEYQSADVLSFPSFNEGFGLPILEAQAVGLPVVTSNLPPMNEISAGGALLVDPHRPTALAEAIETILGDAPVRERLVATGRRNADRHAAVRVAGEYASLHQELLRRRVRPTVAADRVETPS